MTSFKKGQPPPPKVLWSSDFDIRSFQQFLSQSSRSRSTSSSSIGLSSSNLPHSKVTDSGSLAGLVAQHYNTRTNFEQSERDKLDTVVSRNFSNWVKALLIEQNTSSSSYVLDICSGKGGDMHKFFFSVARFVQVDIAALSVQEARKRYLTKVEKFRRGEVGREGDHVAETQYIAADCHIAGLWEHAETRHIVEMGQFDYVQCQFALHYSFESESRARGLLSNISDNLKLHGKFAGTIPNAEHLVARSRSSPNGEFGNSIFHVQFDHSRTVSSPYGNRYLFSLKNAVDRCPEYLVPWETFERLATEYGLTLKSKMPFNEFYDVMNRNKDNYDKLVRMGGLNEAGQMSRDEWEVVNLYLAFVFEKTSDPETPLVQIRQEFQESGDKITHFQENAKFIEVGTAVSDKME